MIQVKKKFQGKNVRLKGRNKFTLGSEVDYSTAFAMNEAGLGGMLIKEKETKRKKETKAKKYKAVDEVTPTAEKEAELKSLEEDRRDSLHTT